MTRYTTIILMLKCINYINLSHIKKHALTNTIFIIHSQKETIKCAIYHTPKARQVKMACDVLSLYQFIFIQAWKVYIHLKQLVAKTPGGLGAKFLATKAFWSCFCIKNHLFVYLITVYIIAPWLINSLSNLCNWQPTLVPQQNLLHNEFPL